MAINAGKVSVGTGATLIYQTPAGVETSLTVSSNNDTVVLGPSTVTAANGFSWTSTTGELILKLDRFTGALYGIMPSGTATVTYLAGDVQ